VVRAGGLEPPRGYPQRIFVPATAFAAPAPRKASQGSWSGLSLHPAPAARTSGGKLRGLGAARLVSTPSRCRAWLGIAVERFPRVWAVLRPRFPAAHSNRVQVRCVCHSATPAWRAKLYPRRRESPRRTPAVRKKVLTRAFHRLYKLSTKAEPIARPLPPAWERGHGAGDEEGGQMKAGALLIPVDPCYFAAIKDTGDPKLGALRCNIWAGGLVKNNENTSAPTGCPRPQRKITCGFTKVISIAATHPSWSRFQRNKPPQADAPTERGARRC
jgi:hypothetical protein